MAKFIELTLQHNGTGLLVNIERLQYVENSDITADDSNFYSVKESYDEIKAKIREAVGEPVRAVSEYEEKYDKLLEDFESLRKEKCEREECIDEVVRENDDLLKKNKQLALELDKLKAEATRKNKNAEWENSVFEKAIAEYGDTAQIGMAMEEMAELIQALNKAMRNEPHNVPEEIADVEIMLEQLKIIYDGEDEVKKFYKEKVKRLDNRIN